MQWRSSCQRVFSVDCLGSSRDQLGLFSRTPKSPSGELAGVFSVFQHLNAVHKYVPHADGKLMRFIKRSFISDRIRIEYNDISEISRFQKSATVESKISGRQSR